MHLTKEHLTSLWPRACYTPNNTRENDVPQFLPNGVPQ